MANSHSPSPSGTPHKSRTFRKPFEAYSKAPHYTTAKVPETYKDGSATQEEERAGMITPIPTVVLIHLAMEGGHRHQHHSGLRRRIPTEHPLRHHSGLRRRIPTERPLRLRIRYRYRRL
ncbi:hypothetical protein N0V85_008515 [Neurospora sp. IMI 360204]|nr:hypothetical protein N0V85_008515 [Neurospora sp. IMI 360204]